MILEIMGVQLHAEQYGQAGPQVLLLHGWGCSIGHFKPIIDALQGDYRLTAIDFPAHGASSAPPEPWNVHDFAKLTAELIRTLGLMPVHIVAHSFGARVAICLAAEQPELVNRLILTGAAGLRAAPTEAGKKKSEAYQRGKQIAQWVGKLPGICAKSSSKSMAPRTMPPSPPKCARPFPKSSARTFLPSCRASGPKRCWCSARRIPRPRSGWARGWKKRSPTRAWWCSSTAGISPTWKNGPASARSSGNF